MVLDQNPVFISPFQRKIKAGFYFLLSIPESWKRLFSFFRFYPRGISVIIMRKIILMLPEYK